MRPNKYDVTTAYRLCQDFVPPDGGDDCGSNTRKRISSIGLLIKVCPNSKKWHCLCRRQRTKWSSANLCHRAVSIETAKFFYRSSHTAQRNQYVLMFRQKLENQRHENQKQYNCESSTLPLLRIPQARILSLPVGYQSDKVPRFCRQR